MAEEVRSLFLPSGCAAITTSHHIAVADEKGSDASLLQHLKNVLSVGKMFSFLPKHSSVGVTVPS